MDEPPDVELLATLRRDPATGWPLFLDRYSGRMLGWLYDLGLQGDDAMDGFVYICEKLAADRCRRLRQIKYLGQRGEMVPWLRQVVSNLATSFAWTRTGRPRLPRAIEALDDLEQEVFRLHFWYGYRSSEVLTRLLMNGVRVTLIDVYSALETVYRSLGAGHRWRLASALERRRQPMSLHGPNRGPFRSPFAGPADGRAGGGSGVSGEPRADIPDPEAAAVVSEQRERLEAALRQLCAEDRLLVRLRFEDDLTHPEIGTVLDLEARRVGRRLRLVLERLRVHLEQRETVVPADQPSDPSPDKLHGYDRMVAEPQRW